MATLVARAAPPEEVFAAVAAEAGQVLAADVTGVIRYDPDGTGMVLGAWSRTGATVPVSVGTRLGPGERNMTTLVFKTGRPARIDDYADATGPTAGPRPRMGRPLSSRRAGHRRGAHVGRHLRGVHAGASACGHRRATGRVHRTGRHRDRQRRGAGRADRLAGADRGHCGPDAPRIERDLHDGVQQRLVSLALRLREVQAAPPEAGELAERLEGAVSEATGALEELREIARGLHPTVLAEGGLRPALRALARRSAVPIRLDIQVAGRLPEPVEIAAYYAVSEALTNTAKHARASSAEVEVTGGEGILHVRVRDDGRGGADFGHGSGLIGLRDRMEALGGRISLLSPPGEGTTLYAELPLTTAAGVTS